MALSPSASRLLEAMCVRLSQRFPEAREATKSHPRHATRERLITAAFQNIRNRLAFSAGMLEGVEMQLFPINKKTVRDWKAHHQHECLCYMYACNVPVYKSPAVCACRVITLYIEHLSHRRVGPRSDCGVARHCCMPSWGQRSPSNDKRRRP